MTELCIAHGGDVGEPSGGTDRVSALAGGLHDRDIDVTLVIPEPSGDLPARLDPVDVEVVQTPVGRVDDRVVVPMPRGGYLDALCCIALH
jgi:hypothetical protein